MYVPIDKGIDNGEIIILPEKGNIVNDKLKWDIKLHIEVINKSRFTRNGLDLFIDH